jgi:uncharacterized protein (DUF2126 family)
MEPKIKSKIALNQFLPTGETKVSIYGFFYNTAGARKSKYAVRTCPNRGKILVLFTFASSYEEAFQIAKSAYQASSYPRVGVDRFMVYGICRRGNCPCGGDLRPENFFVDWSTSQ